MSKFRSGGLTELHEYGYHTAACVQALSDLVRRASAGVVLAVAVSLLGLRETPVSDRL